MAYKVFESRSRQSVVSDDGGGKGRGRERSERDRESGETDTDEETLEGNYGNEEELISYRSFHDSVVIRATCLENKGL